MINFIKLYLNILIRPFQLLLKPNAPVSYAMSIEAVPNKTGWVVGGIVSFVFECDATHNITTTEDNIVFKEADALFAADRAMDDEDVKEALVAQVQKYINLPERLTAARKTINIQIIIEAIITTLVSIAVITLVVTGYNSFMQVI